MTGLYHCVAESWPDFCWLQQVVLAGFQTVIVSSASIVPGICKTVMMNGTAVGSLFFLGLSEAMGVPVNQILQ